MNEAGTIMMPILELGKLRLGAGAVIFPQCYN